MKELSKNFKNLVSDLEKQGIIREKNCSAGGYKAWEKKRRFIAEAINDDGSILDIGCAGGFFLRSLQEWSDYRLVPYGIDIREDFIEAARDLFPEMSDHFAVMDIEDVGNLPNRESFPKKFNFIYCSLSNIDSESWWSLFRNDMLPLAENRVIVGFYAPNRFEPSTKEWKKEREDLKGEMNQFMEKVGLEIAGSKFNPTEFNQGIVCVDV